MNHSADAVHVASGRVSWELWWLPECRAGGIVGGEIESRVAKVCEDDGRICGGVVGREAEEDVAGFDVAMADASAVGIGAAGVEASMEELEGGG